MGQPAPDPHSLDNVHLAHAGIYLLLNLKSYEANLFLLEYVKVNTCNLVQEVHGTLSTVSMTLQYVYTMSVQVRLRYTLWNQGSKNKSPLFQPLCTNDPFFVGGGAHS